MAYTLADFSRQATEPLKKAVIDITRKESFIMDKLPFESTGSINMKLLRMTTLPEVNTRDIGGTYSESKALTDVVEEQACILGGFIDVDTILAEAKNQVTDQRALQTKAFTKAMAYKFNDMFINGLPTTNPSEMVGLKYRVENDLPASQKINANVDVTDPDSSNAGAKLIDAIQALIHACDGHKADVLIMNTATYLKVLASIRSAGLWDKTQDNFGRNISTFGPGGPALLDLGVKANQTDQVLGWEDAGGAYAASLYGSIYAVKFGDEYINGWQFKPLTVTDKGVLENGTSMRTIIEWAVGIYFYNPRSFARLYNIKLKAA